MSERSAMIDVREVINFFRRNLPRNRGAEGWEHYFSTAYQVGCDALVALGQADENVRGATPRADPRLPEILPRWDDICVAVLYLIDQNGLVDFRPADDGSPSLRDWKTSKIVPKHIDAPPSLPPNIIAAHGLNSAWAEPDVLSLFRALGLTSENRWVEAAETVFWRAQPVGWDLDFEVDPRFVAAIESAVKAVPDDIRTELDQLVTMTEADVRDAEFRNAKSHEEFRARHPGALSRDMPLSRERIMSGLVSVRRHALDWLFFRRWRLSDGWLDAVQARSALGIFHDPVAITTRRRVVARLYPQIPAMAG